MSDTLSPMALMERADAAAAGAKPLHTSRGRADHLKARGEPFTWMLGGALALGCIMIVGLLLLVLWWGLSTFVPKTIALVTKTDATVLAGEQSRTESYRPEADVVAALTPPVREKFDKDLGFVERSLYRVGNYDLYGEDFRWVPSFAVAKVEYPKDLLLIERIEWGPFIGRLVSVTIAGKETPVTSVRDPAFTAAHGKARDNWHAAREIEKDEIGAINARIERGRLELKRVELESGADSDEFRAAALALSQASVAESAEYQAKVATADALKRENEGYVAVLEDIAGTKKNLPMEEIVRLYLANDLGFGERIGIYLSRWWEFLSDEPREANTEGGVWPAIFGTFTMTLLMVIAVAPFGVITALYLREYAKQGRMVAFVRISVNNLAGVPSIVYGVFGLGFFAYVLGGSIDALFYPERLPNPTFGTGGLLWASLTLALLTVPVVIVATEEALSAVPRSMREGSLGCGASKWHTIKYIVLPQALPGIMTGIILAMARGAGEVAPLMLVGVVKLVPELPIDGMFPFVHLERSFMHLGFHIFDVGFQSRNSEAGKPMVFVTAMLLIGLVFVMNLTAILVRNRLKKKFATSQF